MQRTIQFVLLALFALLAITAGVAGYLLQDEAFLKTRASKWVFRHTGRELTLYSPLSLTLGSISSLDGS